MSNTSTESGDMTGVTAPKLPQGCETRISRVVADEAGATIIWRLLLQRSDHWRTRWLYTLNGLVQL